MGTKSEFLEVLAVADPKYTRLLVDTLKLAKRIVDDWNLQPAQRDAILFAMEEVVKVNPDIPAVEAALITAHAGSPALEVEKPKAARKSKVVGSAKKKKKKG